MAMGLVWTLMVTAALVCGAVQGMLKVSGYRKYLRCGANTPFELKKRIRLWRNLPWMYKPRRPQA